MAVLVDVQERIEISLRLRANRDRMRRLGLLGSGGLAQHHPHHQARSDSREKLAPGREIEISRQIGRGPVGLAGNVADRHDAPPFFMTDAASKIASTMRPCAPHRHRW